MSSPPQRQSDTPEVIAAASNPYAPPQATTEMAVTTPGQQSRGRLGLLWLAGMVLPIFFALLKPSLIGQLSFASEAFLWVVVVGTALFLNLLAIVLIRNESFGLRLTGVISTCVLQGISLALTSGFFQLFKLW